MEIVTKPGTALLLEPDGLDAPTLKDKNEIQKQLQSINGDQNAVGSSVSHDDDDTIQDDNDEEDRSRVIVRRRVTRGVGFFSRHKDGITTSNEEKNIERLNGGGTEWHPPASNVKPGYSSFKSGIIKLTPESLKCKLYCRGSKCIYCNSENWNEDQQALRGLYSNWIGENILAMARPTERTFKEFDLIGQFKRTEIRTLINLQCVNEHDLCGPQLISNTGFSYDPEILMRQQIYFYNFAIPDFGTASVHSIINIAKVMWFSLKRGRVAIHCHAGLGRTGTLIACFLIWAQGISSSEAIDFVRNARPNSIQSLEQINAVEEFSYHVYKNGTALPNSLFISSNGMISLRQLMTRQRQFLPNEQARRFTHIPKLLYMLGDNLLRAVFGPQGVYYAPLPSSPGEPGHPGEQGPQGGRGLPGADGRPGASGQSGHQHHARSCTFGTIHVNWQNAFTQKGKLQVRQIVNLFARCSAFPYEKDQTLIEKFQQLSLVTIDSLIARMDVQQLISLLNAFMESVKRPYCSRRALIDALGQFSPYNPTDNEPLTNLNEDNDNGENDIKTMENQQMQIEYDDREKEFKTLNVMESKCKEQNESVEEKVNGSTSFEERQTLDLNSEESTKHIVNENIEQISTTTRERPSTMNTDDVGINEFHLFDIHDLHTNKDANLNADWQCIVFYVCNILSYLTGENYDSVVDLLTFWLAGDSNRDVKQAIYCHMRDLFARNMRQQEQQATAWKRRMGLSESIILHILNHIHHQPSIPRILKE